MKKYFVCVWIALFSLMGCGDFLEEQSKDLAYAANCSDLEELLIGGGYMKQLLANKTSAISLKSTEMYFPWLHVMDDDMEEYIAGAPSGDAVIRERLKSFYRWEKDPSNLDYVYFDDPTWTRLYKHIGVLNVVLHQVDQFTEDTEEARRSVKGQSYFLRAGFYYLLVNFYGKPYDISASTDPGVPLKLTPFVEDKNWTRSTVEAVYQQIVSDLKDAIDQLSGLPASSSFYRANESAARMLLSRVYCYMGKWDLVPELCDRVLEKNYRLLDLVSKVVKDTTDGWVGPKSPEIIFSQGTYSMKALTYDGFNAPNTVASFQMSSSLKESFVDGDRRKDFLVDTSTYNKENVVYPNKIKGSSRFPNNLEYLSDVFLLRLPEAYLNKAEALAMTGKEGDARLLLRELMAKRFKPEVLPSVTESGKALIDLIRNERRREFCFEGQRWFDLRRYAVSPKYPDAQEIRHNTYEYISGGTKTQAGLHLGYYVLPAYPDGGWVLPIPPFEIVQNEGKLVNNERGDCLFKEN